MSGGNRFLSAILGAPTQPIRDDMIVHSADGVFAIRKGPWKWIEGVPIDEIRPGVRKAHAEEFRAQLYDLQEDPAETREVSEQRPEIVKELRALLNRYRDGGYSRALPHEGMKRKYLIAELTPLSGVVIMSESLNQLPAKPWTATRGEWEAKDGGVWGMQKGPENQGATLRTPLAITDGTIEYEIKFNGANRHSLRVEWGERKGSFRVEVSRGAMGLTKNPSTGEDKDATEPIARKMLNLESNPWYPVRIIFKCSEVTVQVNDAVMKRSHEVLAEQKTGINFLVFGETAGFRNARVLK